MEPQRTLFNNIKTKLNNHYLVFLEIKRKNYSDWKCYLQSSNKKYYGIIHRIPEETDQSKILKDFFELEVSQSEIKFFVLLGDRNIVDTLLQEKTFQEINFDLFHYQENEVLTKIKGSFIYDIFEVTGDLIIDEKEFRVPVVIKHNKKDVWLFHLLLVIDNNEQNSSLIKLVYNSLEMEFKGKLPIQEGETAVTTIILKKLLRNSTGTFFTGTEDKLTITAISYNTIIAYGENDQNPLIKYMILYITGLNIFWKTNFDIPLGKIWVSPFSKTSKGQIYLELNNPIHLSEIEAFNREFEKILLLISIAGGSWVDWYKQVAYSIDKLSIQEHYRQPKEKSRQFGRQLIPHDQWDTFINDALVAWDRFRSRDKKKLPIIVEWYIEANSKALIEICFLKACICLELLKTIKKLNHSRTYTIISKQDWEDLTEKEFIPIINNEVRGITSIKELIIRIQNVNFKTLQTQIKDFCHEFNIPYQDLFKQESETFWFLKVRNRIVHRGEVTKNLNDKMWNEINNLLKLLDRILLILFQYSGRYSDRLQRFDIKSFPEEINQLQD